MSEHDDLVNEILTAAKKIALKRGFVIPEPNYCSDDSAVFINLTAIQGKPFQYYARKYRELCHTVDMQISWLGQSFTDDQGNEYKIMGLDPDGGDKPIRIVDKQGRHSHASPKACYHWILKNNER